jgi:hypothetical protein
LSIDVADLQQDIYKTNVRVKNLACKIKRFGKKSLKLAIVE